MCAFDANLHFLYLWQVIRGVFGPRLAANIVVRGCYRHCRCSRWNVELRPIRFVRRGFLYIVFLLVFVTLVHRSFKFFGRCNHGIVVRVWIAENVSLLGLNSNLLWCLGLRGLLHYRLGFRGLWFTHLRAWIKSGISVSKSSLDLRSLILALHRWLAALRGFTNVALLRFGWLRCFCILYARGFLLLALCFAEVSGVFTHFHRDVLGVFLGPRFWLLTVLEYLADVDIIVHALRIAPLLSKLLQFRINLVL